MLPANLEELRSRCHAGETFDYLLFYGHTPPADGRTNASCLSQWYVAPFEIDGVTYPTAEHYMMAEKARLFGDEDALEQITASPSPKDAKALGRGVRDFDKDEWTKQRSRIVERGNLAKFSQNLSLRSFLIDTGDKILVEAAPRDRIWGIGLGRNNPAAMDPAQWRGQNLLGFALVLVRSALRE